MTELERNRSAEFLFDLIEQVEEVLIKNANLAEEDAARTAREIGDKMRHHWGGQPIYFPKGILLDVDTQHRQLFDEFNGHNHHDLAKKFDVSVQWVYRVVKAVGIIENRRRQPDLFAEEQDECSFE